ncbi:hypothetical protein KR032_011658, partial [Drosophila birchii]
MPMKRNYHATFVSLGCLENCTLWDISQLKIKGRERLLNGTFDLLDDMDDEHYTFAGDMWNDAQGDGNYKLYPFAIEKDTVCKTYKAYRSYFQKNAEYGVSTDFPVHIDPCPIKKGHYYLKNIALSTDAWPTVVPRGYTRVTGSFYKDDVLVGTYFLTVLLED